MLSSKLKEVPLDFRPSKRRKTLSLKVCVGKVVIAYPVWVGRAEVYDWLNEKADWICQHYQPAAPKSEERPYTPSSVLWWLGEEVEFKTLFPVAGGFYSAPLHEQKAEVLAFCADYLRQDIGERVKHFEQCLGLWANHLKLRPYKSRWGSCDHKGLVALNTLLAMAPAWVVDYVIVHELCHLKHPNHSKAFWAEVERGCSRLRIGQAKAWLRAHGDALLKFYR